MPVKPNQAHPITPTASRRHSYSVENLGEFEWDSGAPCDEEAFQDCANLEEGINGCKPIDSTYENTDEDYVFNPRSDHGFKGEATHRRPAPHDVKKGRFPHRY